MRDKFLACLARQAPPFSSFLPRIAGGAALLTTPGDAPSAVLGAGARILPHLERSFGGINGPF